MINLCILLSFNIIIIILSYFFKNKIIVIYPFILLLFITMYIKLYYKKNYGLIEGFDKSEVDSFWDELDDENINDNFNNDLFGKINDVLKLLVKLEKTPEYELYGDKQCKGKFKITESDKTCGFDEYDEYKYVITEPGVGCKYPPGHTERKNKPLCKLKEPCVLDQDCDIGKCNKGICKRDFQCDSTKMENCDEEGCLKLNDTFGKGFYKYDKNIKKCNKNPCTKEQYYDCDNEEDCTDLGYNFKWRGVKTGSELEKLGKIYGAAFSSQCVLMDNEVTRCSQHNCPSGYTVSEKNKNYKCKQKLSEKDKAKYPGNSTITTNEKGEMFIDECMDEVCCQPNYKCGDYYSGDFTNTKCKNCKDDEKCPSCSSPTSASHPVYTNFYGNPSRPDRKPNDMFFPYFYNYKAEKKVTAGKKFEEDNICSGLTCTEGECTKQNICKCDNGTPETGVKCTTNGSNICASCKVKDGYNLNKTLNTCDKCELKDANIDVGCGDYECAAVEYHAGPVLEDCSKISASNVCVQSWFGTNSSLGGYRCLWRNDRCVNRGGLKPDLHCPLKPIPKAVAEAEAEAAPEPVEAVQEAVAEAAEAEAAPADTIRVMPMVINRKSWWSDL